MTHELCEHLRTLPKGPKSEGGCTQCIERGETWVHLRFCVTCGAVGCCNDSKNKHATRHAAATGHPVLRSKEPGENWAWCCIDEMLLELPSTEPGH